MTTQLLEKPLTDADYDAVRIRWARSPELYFKERLGIDLLWEGERRMLRAAPYCVWNRKPMVITSGHALGKDFTVSGGLTLWFYECFAPCKVTGTGPTERQVLDIMWNELKNRLANRPVKDDIGRLISGKLEGNEEHFITVFTTKDSGDNAGKFQGIHAARMMIVVTEAQAVDDKIFEQIDGITTSGMILQVYLGNPLTNNGRFARMIDDTTNNVVIRLDCLESPNVIEKRQVIPGLVDHHWVEDKRRRWNPDGLEKDPRWLARVRGIKPDTTINTVISQALYKTALNKNLTWWTDKKGTIGVDPAGTGTDDMIIYVMESGRELDEITIPYCEAPEACSHVLVAQKKWFPGGGCNIVIDCDGMGAPIFQFLRKMLPENMPNEIKMTDFFGSSTDKEKVSPEFQNLRAESAFFTKQMMMEGKISFGDNQAAFEEAIAEEYFCNLRGKLQLEDKDDIRERLGRSPDRWDARKLAIWGFKDAEPIKGKDGWKNPGRRSLIAPADGTSFMTA